MRLVREGPNAHQAWPDFIEFIVAQVLLRGSAGLAEIVADNAGTVRELRPNSVGVVLRSTPAVRPARL